MDNNQLSLDLIKQLKNRILRSRYIVAKVANAEALRLYFSVGKIIDEEFKKNNWGAKVIDEISERLQKELPGIRGFSGKNIAKMRTFYKAWKNETSICSTLTSQFQNTDNTIYSTVTSNLKNNKDLTVSSLTTGIENTQINSFLSISFSHHYEIILKIKKESERWYYIHKTARNFWSVRHLRTELTNQSHLHAQKPPNNFKRAMSNELSNKALRAFKDQYLLDFVNIEDTDEELDERVLEHKIVHNIRKFLMSLGNDFSFMGNQFRMMVNETEYFIDLLFFHRGLQALVAFELKTGKFKPEYVGKMNFYLSALDDLVKQPHENPTIGIILCKEQDNKKVEYSFRDFSKPMGVAIYKTSETLPPQLKNALPDAETLKKLMY
jgi:predicted nuclease of restriction endonuclease-like (RecB) superfamily